MKYTIDEIICNLELRQQLYPCNLPKYPSELIDVFELFVDALISARKSPNTIASYYFDIKVFLDYVITYCSRIKLISNINVITIKKYYKYLETIKNNSHTSINRKKMILKMFFEYLIEQNIIDKDNNPIPIEGIIKSKSNRKKKLPVYLEADEITQLYRAIDNDKCSTFIKKRNLSIFTLMINSGLRISELLSLNLHDMEDINKRNTLTVTGKGEKERIIPINKEELENGSLKSLNTYYKMRINIETTDRALFISNRKKRITTRTIQKMIKKYGELAIIQKSITPHKLRHTYATQLTKNNVNLRTVQELLGHSSISTTQIYTHVNIDDLKRDVSTLSYDV